jgi:hypothetical protein
MLIMQRFYKAQRVLCREDGLQLWRNWTGRARRSPDATADRARNACA